MQEQQPQQDTSFVHKKMSKCTLGARLKTLRSVEHLSREELARRSGVRAAHIAALEEGRFEALPATVYVHGFLRAIAAVLRTRPKHLITLYDREVGIARNLRKGRATETAANPQLRRVYLYRALFTPRLGLSLLGGALALGGVLYLYTVLHALVSAPYLIVAAPESGATVTTPEVVVEGSTDPAATVTIAGEDVVVGQDGHFTKKVFLRPGTNDIALVATNRFDKATRRHLAVDYVPPVVEAPAPPPDHVTLAVRVEDKRTWLKVVVDGETVLAETVQPGFTQTFEGKEIIITSGGGARTMVARDGGDFAPLAEAPGLVKDVRFALEEDASRDNAAAQDAGAAPPAVTAPPTAKSVVE